MLTLHILRWYRIWTVGIGAQVVPKICYAPYLATVSLKRPHQEAASKIGLEKHSFSLAVKPDVAFLMRVIGPYHRPAQT